jgi:parallel beta-helix repeat protein
MLPGDLGPCRKHGLTIRSPVRLDCRGFTIRGLGDGTEQVGIFLRGEPHAPATGATVRACRVTGFLRGIRLRAASGNAILHNVASGNGDFRRHVGYGIDLSAGSSRNTLEGNTAQGNADEGVHVGPGSRENRLSENTVTDNHRESLYLLRADGGVFLRNTLGGKGVNSLYLKDSSGNLFEGNRFVDRPARIVGDSRDNRFVDNTLSGAGLHFRHYEASPTRHPVGNRVLGGSITGGTDCLRFTSSSGNVVTGTALTGCGTQVRSEAPAGAAENTLVSIAPVSVALDEGSTLHLGWRLDVRVRDRAGAPLPGARVSVSEAGTPVAEAVTGETGDIATQVLIGATRTGTRTVSRGPYTLTTSLAGYAPDMRALSVGEDLRLGIALEAARAPR